MTAILDDEYVTIAEAAALLTVHKSTIRRWIDRGELPAYRIGRRCLALKRADLAGILAPAHDRTMSSQSIAAGVTSSIVRRLSPTSANWNFGQSPV